MRLITLLGVFVCLNTYAQELTYRTADSITYKQLIDKQYNEVIRTGKAAVKQDIEFYYLRLRLGISYFKKKNYDNAVRQFKKAHAMNPNDSLCSKYLYYSYLYANRREDANALASTFTKSLQKKVYYKKKGIDVIAIGGGSSLNDNSTSLSSKDINGAQDIYGQASYQGSNSFVNLYLQHTIKNRFKLYYGASHIRIKSLNIVQLKDARTDEFTNTQSQFNIGAAYHFNNGITLSAGFGRFNILFSTLVAYQNTDAILPPPYSIYTYSETQNSNVGTINISKRLRYITPSVAYTASTFNKSTQHQGEVSLAIYPLGNPNFYFITGLANVQDSIISNTIFSQKIGGKLSNKIWTEIGLSTGDHSNYVSNGGFITYNSSDPIEFIANFDLKFFLKNLEINPGYTFRNYSSSYSYAENPTLTQTEAFNYSIHFITTSLKWHF